MGLQIKTLRSSTSGNRPLGHVYGEMYVNLGDLQVGCVDSNGQPQDFVGVRFFSQNANYAVGQFAIHAGDIYKCIAPVISGNAWTASQWARVTTTGDIATGFLPLTGGTMQGPLNVNSPGSNTEAARVDWVYAWVGSAYMPLAGGAFSGQIYVQYPNAQNSAAQVQWVEDYTSGTYMPKGGGTFTGRINLVADPINPMEPTTKQYVDNGLNAKLNLSGGTMTGSLIPLYTPTFSDVARGDWVRDYTNANYLPLAGGTVTGNFQVNGGFNCVNVEASQNIEAQGWMIGHNYVQSLGNSYASASFQGPYLGGGTNGAGWLQGISQSNHIAFQWASPAIVFNIDNSYSKTLAYTQSPQAFNIQAASGAPSGQGLTFYGPSATGTLFSCYIDATSDRRIKENIKDSTVDALSIVTQLQVREFDYTDEHLIEKAKSLNPVLPLPSDLQKIMTPGGLEPPTKEMIEDHRQNIERREAQQRKQDEAIKSIQIEKHHRIGLITQEVQPLIPEMVGEIEDLQHIIYKNAVPYLIKAIQQLTAKVADLEQQLSTLATK